MHRLAAMPGGWEAGENSEGVIFIAQTPAPLVLLTAADTDIQVLAQAIAQLPADFPAVRVVNLLQLQQQLTMDTYADSVLAFAQGILLRLLGGRAYWSYGLEVVKETVSRTGASLYVLPGDDRPDPDLISHSTVPLTQVDHLWRYFIQGGVENGINALKYLACQVLGYDCQPEPTATIPLIGLYPGLVPSDHSLVVEAEGTTGGQNHPRVGILFYRAHRLAGNTHAIDALCQSLREQGLIPVPVFVQSLQDPELQAKLLQILQPHWREDSGQSPSGLGGDDRTGVPRPKASDSEFENLDLGIDLLINTTSFSLAKLAAETLNLKLWQQLDVPVIQAICSGGTVERWQAQLKGLAPRDMAMNVALPEVDGRIISRAISFKAVQARNQWIETDVIHYQPQADRIQFVTELAANWVCLRRTCPAERRIALILANYPTRDGRLANGVGLDTPASCVEILKAMQHAGYTITDCPATGDELIQQLTQGVTNDPEARDIRQVYQQFPLADYQAYWATLPAVVQQQLGDRWGDPAASAPNGTFAISGLQLGNVFVGIQPARGYDLDPSLNYHAPDLEPTHAYLAFYAWLRQQFQVQAIVHVGKHGNLEWLPGKSVALADTCYPEIALGPLPHLYPFIVNDPGEGTQAKRRSQAVIIDHLTPPLTRAELYGPLQQLEALIDEYYEAQSLDPSRLPVICDHIAKLMQQEHLEQELESSQFAVRSSQFGVRNQSWGRPDTEFGVSPADDQKMQSSELGRPLDQGFEAAAPVSRVDALTQWLGQMDGYLCELKEAQIRDGLHIFGHCPQGQQLRDLTVALARHPSPGHLGITRAIAQAWTLDLDPLTTDPAQCLTAKQRSILNSQRSHLDPQSHQPRIVGDAIEILEQQAAHYVEELIESQFCQQTRGSQLTLSPADDLDGRSSELQTANHELRTTNSLPTPLSQELAWIRDRLLPNLDQTTQEITHLLRGLDGRYVPSGASGAPTRGRPDVLPTGRNFYAVDIRALPTESAWDVGRKAAEVLVERYTQEQGEYPRSLGLSVWGTATMRTGGDDVAEALALLGVRPVWEGLSRRVIDIEILPLSLLGRPRVDVTLRISGFFRDAFANLIDLFDRAVNAVARLDEPADQNPLAAQFKQECHYWQDQGLTVAEAQGRSRFRIFGSKPGAYGAGLQGLIDAQNWQDDHDLARAYINWSSYAYTAQSFEENSCSTGAEAVEIATEVSAPEAFEQRLRQLQIVLHNQDNREHDLLDSDDYYQFQGGLTAAVRSRQGQNPQIYFGDHAIPTNPKVRRLQEELARVYRSRVVNPKWIAGAMRHGYKGAFEMAATVDYLFAYDATTHCVEDHWYQGVANAYVLDPKVQAFIQKHNPWALRDMAERLLEAKQRGLWQQVNAEMVEELRAIAHQAEGAIEKRQHYRSYSGS
jgi:cobaltochelatase CobN